LPVNRELEDYEGDTKRTNTALREALEVAGSELVVAKEELQQHRDAAAAKNETIVRLNAQIKELHRVIAEGEKGDE